jgi:transcriptional regulator with XRE-family HTH domain
MRPGNQYFVVGKDFFDMIMVNNPFGQDPMDFDNETAASRVGSRIRKIRTEKGMSQAELGELVGLNADRIQKYENGARKPKADLLKQIAEALGVSTLALTDPNTTSYIGAMYAFFEMENHFNVQVEEGPEDKAPSITLSVSFKDGLYKYMEEWVNYRKQIQAQLETAGSDEEREEIRKRYHNWEWNYPQGIVDKTEQALQKARIKSKIEELQKAYERLEGNIDDK